MPNMILNKISFGTDASERTDFENFLKTVSADESFLGDIDFNKIIPIPADLKRVIISSTLIDALTDYQALLPNCQTFEQMAALKEKYNDIWEDVLNAHANVKAYGVMGLLDWKRSFWGSKLNAQDCHIVEGGSALIFQTAWNFPLPIFSKISQMNPQNTVYVGWDDEDADAIADPIQHSKDIPYWLSFKNGEPQVLNPIINIGG